MGDHKLIMLSIDKFESKYNPCRIAYIDVTDPVENLGEILIEKQSSERLTHWDHYYSDKHCKRSLVYLRLE